jgi:hypothetical protein
MSIVVAFNRSDINMADRRKDLVSEERYVKPHVKSWLRGKLALSVALIAIMLNPLAVLAQQGKKPPKTEEPPTTVQDTYIEVGKGGWVGSGYSNHNYEQQVFEYRWDNVVYFSTEGIETGRGSLTSRYHQGSTVAVPHTACSFGGAIPTEMTLIIFKVGGYIVLQTPMTAQQVRHDPGNADASYLCNRELTLVLIPHASEGNIRCATGKSKATILLDEPLKFSQGIAGVDSQRPIADGALGGGVIPGSDEGRIVIPANPDCE